MVQPRNYMIDVQSPFQAFGEAAQFGLGLAELDARRQAAQQEAVRQESLNQEIQRVNAIQNPTADDYRKLSFLLPKAQMDSVRATFELGSKEQQANQLSFSGKVLAAFTSGNNQVAIDLLNNRADAEENSGKTELAKGFRDSADLAKINPLLARNTIAVNMAVLPNGKEVIEAALKLVPAQPKAGFTLLTPAQNIELGFDPKVRLQRSPTGELVELKLSAPPKEGFRMLTDAEKKERGLLVAESYQIDSDEKVYPIRTGPGVSVKVDTGSGFGKVPPGFQRIVEADGTVREIEIPGGVAERERLDAEKKALGRQNQTARAGGTVVQDLQRALNLVRKNPNVTGRAAALTLALPMVARAETDVQAAEAFIQSALSNVGLDTLQNMRENSPTGGALGQVPIQQQQRLEQVLGSLDLTQRKEVVEDNIKRVINIYNDIINGTPQQILERLQRGDISKSQADNLSFRLPLSFDERGNPLPKEQPTGRDRGVPRFTPATPPATPPATGGVRFLGFE